MSVNLRILVPESSVNYIKNPSPRYDVTGYTAVGATITRSLERSRFSIASVKIVTAGAALHEGAYYRVSDLSGISDVITASVYVRGAGKVRLRLINNPSGLEWFTPAYTLNDDRWHRLEISGNATGSNDMRLYIETDALAASAVTFYADGFQMERKPYATSYLDGSQDGCRWNITAYATASSRDATSRAGGRWVPLAGPCRPDNNLYVTLLGGFGMPKIDNQTQSWSNSAGSFFQDYKVQDRTLTLSFFVKKLDLTPTAPPDPVVLHELRQQVIDIIKPDKTVGGEAFLFEYSTTESDRPLYIRARYDAGLEGSWDVRNQWVNAFPLRLLCVDPFWFEDDQEVASLGIRTTYAATNIFGQISGEWKPLVNPSGITLTNTVTSLANAPDGTLYIAGVFTNNGLTRIVKWDGVTFTVLGSGMNGQVNALTVGLDGILYATGAFTVAGGVAVANVAKYNPVTNTWSAMGTGLAGGAATGFAICTAPNGQIYVGGDFTSAGGVSCLYISRWDGLQWRTVGATSGFSNRVNCLVNARDGKTIYAGGRFTGNNGSTITYNLTASIDIDTNLISALGYGLSGGGAEVLAMAVGLDGTLYAGGEFITSGSPSAATLARVAQWSGGLIWLPLGAGLDNDVFSLAIGVNGELIATGKFLNSGTRPVSKIARWENSTWTGLELFISTATTPVVNYSDSLLSYPNGDVYVGLVNGNSVVNSVPKLTTVINTGTASAYPLLYYTGSGTLRYLENIKTKQAIYLNLFIQPGEEIILDFAKGKIISTVRGDLSYTILPGSEIRSIYLVPGDNTISALVTDDVNGVMQMRYTPQHHSSDSVVVADAL